MRCRRFVAMGVCLGVMLLPLCAGTPLAAQASAQKGKPAAAKAKEDRIDGTVQSVDKKTKTLVVRLRGKNDRRDVMYDDSTKFTFRNKAATLDEVKDGRRIIALGKFNDKGQLTATRVDVRDKM